MLRFFCVRPAGRTHLEMHVLYEKRAGLKTVIQSIFTPLSAYAFIVYVLLYMPCVVVAIAMPTLSPSPVILSLQGKGIKEFTLFPLAGEGGVREDPRRLT